MNFSLSGKGALLGLSLSGLASFSAMAQDEQADYRYRVGFKGGVQFSNLYADEVSDENAKVGLQGGVFLRTPVSSIFSVQPELIYTSKGAKLNYTAVVNGHRQNQVNLGYLELPVLFRINPTRTFSIHVGPYGSYLVHANLTKKDALDATVTGDQSKVDADNFQRFDYGAAGGVEFNLRWFDIGARYDLGLRNVSNGSGLSNQLAKSGKNNALQFYLAVVL